MTDLVSIQMSVDSRQVKTANNALRDMDRHGKQAEKSVTGLGRQLSYLVSAASIGLAVRQVIAYSDAWQSASNQLRQVTSSTEELTAVQQRLLDVANQTRADFDATATLYSRLARSSTDLGLSQEDLIGLTTTINQSFAASGASAAEAAGAIRQLSQGLAAGALRGDEFNSVAENAPGIMRAIAKSLNLTIGELREFAASGGITAEIVVKALQQASGEIENNFSKSVATFGQSMTIANNNMMEFVGNSSLVISATSILGEMIVSASENIDVVAKGVGVLSVVMIGKYVPAATIALARTTALSGGLFTVATASRAASLALSFFGGPLGLAITALGTAAVLLMDFGDAKKKATKASEEHTASIVLENNAIGSQIQLTGEAQKKALQKEIAITNDRLRLFEMIRQGADVGEGLSFGGEAEVTPFDLAQFENVDAAIAAEIQRLDQLNDALVNVKIETAAVTETKKEQIKVTEDTQSHLEEYLQNLETETRLLGLDSLEREKQRAIMHAQNLAMKEGNLLTLEQVDLINKHIERQHELTSVAKETVAVQKTALQEYAEVAMNTTEQIDQATVRGFRSMEDALVEFTRTGKMNFKDMANSIIEDMIRISIRQSITGPLAGAFGNAITSGIGSMFGGGMAAPTVGAPLSTGVMVADGGGYTGSGARSGGLDGRGGFPAILHPQETVIDHTKPGRVSLNGGGGGVIVNVINNGSGEASVSRSTGPGGMPQIDVMIDQAVARKVGQRGSATNAAMRSNFNLSEGLATR